MGSLPTGQDLRLVKCARLPKDADEQVDLTVREMIRITCVEAWNEGVHWLAADARLPHHDRVETADAFTRFVRSNVKFEFDPEDVELLRTPSYYARRLRARLPVSGDCDDLALLLGTMLYSQGFQVAYVVMAASPIQWEFRHVFVAALVKHRDWRYYDPSVTRAYSTDGLRRRWYYTPFGKGPPPRL